MLIAAHISGINGKGELVYEQSILEISAAERKFFCEGTILLEIEELLSCTDMIQRCQVSLGRGDPMAPFQSRIKRADSMREKQERHGLPITTDSALKAVWAAAGSRLVCPFVQNIYQTTDLIRAIPGVRIQKDSNHGPKPNGYRSYHMILSLPLRFLGRQLSSTIWLEVQLRTIAMDCWACMEHQLKYKRSIPSQKLIVQELKRCADEITSTDLSLQAIRELIESPEEELE